MDALVMAGGMGKRLGKDEKPLTLLFGKPLIHYVLDALLCSRNIGRIFIATSPRVNKTNEWLFDFKKKNDKIAIIHTDGEGFVHDMIGAIMEAGITGSVFIMMADLPLVTTDLIDRIIEKYTRVNTPALSVHMKLDVFTKLGLRPDTVFHKNDDFIVPCGINILDAGMIEKEQEDFNLILDEEELALNVNAPGDLEVCEKYLNGLLKSRNIEIPFLL
ncbi:MAG: NTP transferase domain-containing protein [Candidatus Methanoperedens sp.]|nr:NTP transferase domain-containing protein [Candidatus Methanoperedens sp.]